MIGAPLQLERYFEGDLDPVERRRFERSLEDPEVRAAFEAAWDARTEALGLFALTPADGAFARCLSDSTLAMFARGRLTDDEAEIVRGHLDCPDCRARLTRSQSPVEASSEPGREPAPVAVMPGLSPAPEVAPTAREASFAGSARGSEAVAAPVELARRRRWAGLVAGLGTAAAAAAAFALHFGRVTPLERLAASTPALDVRFAAGSGPRVRGVSVTPGQQVTLRTTGHAEGLTGTLRVYLRGTGVVVECPADPACRSEEDGVVFTRTLGRRGEWTASWFLSTEPLPPSTGDLELDLRALDAAQTPYRFETTEWEVR